MRATRSLFDSLLQPLFLTCLVTVLGLGCSTSDGSDPSDPSGSTSCPETFTLQSMLASVQDLLKAANQKIVDLQAKVDASKPPTCETPDPTVTWKCSDTIGGTLLPVKLTLLTRDEVAKFQYPTNGCYVRVDEETVDGGQTKFVKWFFAPVPPMFNHITLTSFRVPYDLRVSTNYDNSTDHQCSR
jgi:hypothetical protein